ncbi:helix-turn-helix domain-containing protein [Nonomuraea sp. NBC_00507]|uniref:helix-turn-helix domain-containing protein n=1 Tax=Nonomuraea sp. NBC_00507 TaxID=2976002 RepID=UPI002E18E1D4
MTSKNTTVDKSTAGGRHKRPTPPDPLQEFAQELRDLRARAGNPSYRRMKRKTGYSASELSEVAAGEKLPSLALTQAYVAACGGDQAEWTKIWHTLRGELDKSHDTVVYPRVSPAYPPQQARPRRSSVKTWVIVGVLGQVAVVSAFAVIHFRQGQVPASVPAVQTQGPTPRADGALPARPQAEPTTSRAGQPRPQRTRLGPEPQPQRTQGGSTQVRPAFSAVAGPGCPRDTSRSVRINGVPGRDGWKDASAPGWTGAGCGDSFLFSELTYDPLAATHPQNSFQWRFTTGLRGQRQCLVGVYVPKSGFAGQRVWYTVSDGFDEDARTVAEFTLDQRMRQGTWVPAPVPVVVTTGLVMVKITDNGKGNTTGDQSMVAGPVRLACL